eukprot:Hpha_TRINITY_DN15627_c3_g5::TRINITY_DN15627_c3_g5_i2::g.98654::m.98654
MGCGPSASQSKDGPPRAKRSSEGFTSPLAAVANERQGGKRKRHRRNSDSQADGVRRRASSATPKRERQSRRKSASRRSRRSVGELSTPRQSLSCTASVTTGTTGTRSAGDFTRGTPRSSKPCSSSSPSSISSTTPHVLTLGGNLTAHQEQQEQARQTGDALLSHIHSRRRGSSATSSSVGSRSSGSSGRGKGDKTAKGGLPPVPKKSVGFAADTAASGINKSGTGLGAGLKAGGLFLSSRRTTPPDIANEIRAGRSKADEEKQEAENMRLRRFACSFCDRALPNKRAMQEHIEDAHGDGGMGSGSEDESP